MAKDNLSFLIINPFGIGDVLFSTPLISNLKKRFPKSKIYYLCNSRSSQILRDNPAIAEIFIYDRDEFECVRQASFVRWIKKGLDFVSKIRKKNIDIAIDLSLNSQFGFLSWAAGIRRRVGLNYKGRGRFLTDKIDFSGFIDRHVTDYYLDVLRALDIPIEIYPFSVFTHPDVALWAKTFIEKHHLQNQRIVGFVPCGGEAFGKDAKIRRWPQNQFAELAIELITKYKVKIFLFAGPKEKDEIANILEKIGHLSEHCYDLSETRLDEMIALMDYCCIFVGNNTGPLRFVDALLKPVVALVGPVDETVYGTYPPEHGRVHTISKHLACQPCYRKFRLDPCLNEQRCLTQITVKEVMDVVDEWLCDDSPL